MNVLIYSDEGTSLESVKHTKECLRFHLSPHYAVSTITKKQSLEDPWIPYTSLLVVPGGADLPYCRDSNGLGNQRIREFVRKGGNYLGICAGAYYAAAQIEFEAGTALEVSGPRELSFYNGKARGAVYSGFQYGSDVGARAAPVKSHSSGIETFMYFNGGCLFEGDSEAEVIASYEGAIDLPPPEKDLSGPPHSNASVVSKKVGRGRVLLSGTHFEYELDPKVAHSRDIDPKVIKELYEARQTRNVSVRELLGTHSQLKICNENEASVPQLSSLYLSSLSGLNPSPASLFIENMTAILENNRYIKDSNDNFASYKPGEHPDQNHGAKTVFVYEKGCPSARETPFFNHNVYFAELERMIALQTTPSPCRLGTLMMYGEVVTSTSTMLERNPKFSSRVPNGMVIFGSQQVAGRGRGSNVWVNPIGVMAVSGVIRIPQTQCQQSLVFIQYLSSIALVNAINSFLNKDIGLRIKWPNDLYSRLDETSSSKVSGVIVSCHVFSGDFVIVFGSGTNVDNPTPTISLNSRIAELDAGPQVRIEQLLARFLTMFDQSLQRFLVSGFGQFQSEYTSMWSHSNAKVILERYGNISATVTGISPDTGMLVAENASGERYELQPDGNSFDMMRGLIKRKI